MVGDHPGDEGWPSMVLHLVLILWVKSRFQILSLSTLSSGCFWWGLLVVVVIVVTGGKQSQLLVLTDCQTGLEFDKKTKQRKRTTLSKILQKKMYCRCVFWHRDLTVRTKKGISVIMTFVLAWIPDENLSDTPEI